MSTKPTYEELEKQLQSFKEDAAALVKTREDLKKAETALLKSEEKYLKSFESITDSITITRIEDGRYFFVNEGFCRQTGYSREEVLGRTPSDINLYANPGEREKFIEIVKKHGKAENVLVNFRRKGGEIYYSEFSAMPLSYAGEACIVAQSKDITKRKRTENALRESEAKYRLLVEHLPQKIFIKDLDSVYILSNEHYAEGLKIKPAEIVGKTDFDFYSKELAEKYRADDQRVMKSGRTEIIEERYVQDGRKTWVNTVKTPVCDPDGEIIGILGIFFDITDRKELESRLRQAQKMESIGNLAGGIAHDFNNLLSPIIGISELLLEDLPKGSLERENAEQILKAGRRGSDLVKQILAFSRQSEHRMIPTRIQRVLKEVLKLGRSAISSYIEIHHDIQPDCGNVMADPSQIHQVAMNIMTNAYHAVEEKGGKISMVLNERVLEAEDMCDIDLEPGEYAVFSISDTGDGIPADLMNKIFEPYFTTKKKGKGTGLGLAVAYGIIQEHQGTIKIDSEIGKGTTFSVYLPLMKNSGRTGSSFDTVESRPGGTERIWWLMTMRSWQTLKNRCLREWATRRH